MKMLAFLILCLGAVAFADDFKTNTGKEYKNATISRVEPDGIVITFSGGIVKIPFTELSPEVQKKYGYDPAAGKKFAAESAEEQRELYQKTEETKAQLADQRAEQARLQAAEKALPAITIYAVIKPNYFREKNTGAWIQPYRQLSYGWDKERFPSPRCASATKIVRRL